MSKTEHRIAYKAGITRTPSDFLCEDGELAECINLTTENEELKVVPQPESMFGGAAKDPLIYVHEGSNYKNYITLNNRQLGFFDADGTTGTISSMASDKPLITHVGNILVVCDGTKMQYFLWKPDSKSYKGLGNKIPEPKIEFAMVYGNWGTANRSGYNCGYSGNIGDCLEFNAMPNSQGIYAWNYPQVPDGKQGQYNDLVIGLYSKSLKGLAENKLFAEPFVIRYALELHDGSYTYLSAPIMMFPAITCNCYADYFDSDLRMNVFGFQLAFKSVFDYSEWTDIVKGVTVFASDGVNLYDLGTDQSPRAGYTSSQDAQGNPSGVKWYDGITATATSGSDMHSHVIRRNFTEHSMKYKEGLTDATRSWAERGFVYFLPLNSRSATEILDDLKSASVFYKLFEAGTRGTDAWVSSKSYIKSHVLDNLTTQDQLDTDDYYSRCPLVPQFLMSYNSRLHLAGVSRGFYEGYESFLPFDNDNEYTYDVYVYIRTPSGTRVVKHSYPTYEKAGIYFFYPDPRAYKAVVFTGSTCISVMDLQEHPSLNGAYYFGSLPTSDDSAEPSAATGEGVPSKSDCEAAVNMTAEPLSNQIFTSEVNNPFVFTYKGNKTIGTGNIVALATLTTALSQGQFGQHPVIVFSTDGIWAMEVEKEGYLEPAQPMSREVCINANTILETDGAVFFASKKGLMIIMGNQVKCVSSQMNGKAFNTNGIPAISTGNDWNSLITSCADNNGFLQFIRSSSCFLAYDYIDNRILIINPSYTYSFLFSMIDGSVSKMVIPSGAVRTVRSYPDYLLQSSDGKVWSLYDKKDETELNTRQKAFILTRPMKMSGPVSVKSLRELVNVGYWDKKAGSKVKTQVFVSDDLVDWYHMESRFGPAAKYFRIALYIEMLPTERLSGTILFDQERRDENVRINPAPASS